MKKKLTILLIAFSLNSFSQETEKKNLINVTTFKTIPTELNGCGEWYYKNKINTKNWLNNSSNYNEELVYFEQLSNVENRVCMISIDGKELVLHYKLDFKEGNETVSVFSNEEYTIYIHKKKLIEKYDDGAMFFDFFSSEIVIIDKSKRRITLKVFSAKGC